MLILLSLNAWNDFEFFTRMYTMTQQILTKKKAAASHSDQITHEYLHLLLWQSVLNTRWFKYDRD